MKSIEETLWVQTDIGGVARYERDSYQRVSNDESIPGNPWIISTMWLAQYYTAIAKSAKDLEHVVRHLKWAVSRALPSGVLAEQINPYTGEPVSVSPLTWSHATVVQTVIDYLDKLQELHTGNQCGRSIFIYNRKGRQQLKSHASGYTDEISEKEHFHYLDHASIMRGNKPVTVNVDGTKCVGCGICAANSDGSMEVVLDKAKIVDEKASAWNIRPGIEKCCPLGAIAVVENNEDKT